MGPESATSAPVYVVPTTRRYAVAFGTGVQRNVVRPAGITDPLAGDWSVATGAPFDPNVKSWYFQMPARFAQMRPKYVPAASRGTRTLL